MSVRGLHTVGRWRSRIAAVLCGGLLVLSSSCSDTSVAILGTDTATGSGDSAGWSGQDGALDPSDTSGESETAAWKDGAPLDGTTDQDAAPDDLADAEQADGAADAALPDMQASDDQTSQPDSDTEADTDSDAASGADGAGSTEDADADATDAGATDAAGPDDAEPATTDAEAASDAATDEDGGAAVDAEPVDAEAMDAAGSDADAGTVSDVVADAVPDTLEDTLADALEDALDDAGADAAADSAGDVQVADAAPDVWTGPDLPTYDVPEWTGAPAPLMTEVVTSNEASLEDEDGDDSDWIELHNPHQVPVELGGLWLSDSVKNPKKWLFPDRQLAPGAYLIVFASDKDRAPEVGELHTNFKLSADGETLVLSAQDGTPIQILVVPKLLGDVSYGASFMRQELQLLDPAATCWYTTELAAEPSATAAWTETSGPSWFPATTAVGFELDPAPPAGVLPLGATATVAEWTESLGPPLTDSVSDWSTTGAQGYKGWIYGWYNRSADLNKTYTQSEFAAFPAAGGNFSSTNWWNGAQWLWYGGPPPWTRIGADALHPSGSTKTPEHWPIRRWQASTPGAIVVLWRVYKLDATGNGVTARVFHNGLLRDVVTIEGGDIFGQAHLLTLSDVQMGDVVDFALSPVGPNGKLDEGGDSSQFSATIWSASSLQGLFSTDVSAEMAGQSAALTLRCPIVLPEDPTLTEMKLRLRTDDAVEAFVDGVPVWSAFLPEDVTPGAKLESRSDHDVTGWLEAPLTEVLAGMSKGEHVLALRGWNADEDDGDFLLAPEVIGAWQTWHPDKPYYFVQPTPGGPNLDGSPNLGPLLTDLTPTAKLTAGQPLLVQVRAKPTTLPVADLTLHWRIDFTVESVATLHDDGLDGDLLAGDGIYATLLPAAKLTAGKLVRWYVTGTDTVGTTTRLPPFSDPDDTEQYHGTIVTPTLADGALRTLHLYVPSTTAANTQLGTRGALWHAGELYDNVRVDVHGNSTLGLPKKSWDVDLPRDHRFYWREDAPRYKDINLLSNHADKSRLRNTIAYEIHQQAGSDWHAAEPVRLLVGGQFWGLMDLVEEGDNRFLERLGHSPDGALYKCNEGLSSVELCEKKTREDEDKSDLQALVTALKLPAAQRRTWLYDNVNLPALVAFATSYDLTANQDCCHKNFYVYRDTLGSGEWRMMPWDVDLSLGRMWSASLFYFDDILYADQPLRVGAGNNALLAAVFALPEFEQMYRRRLRSVMDGILQPNGTPAAELWLESRLAFWLGLVSADAALDKAKWGSWGISMTAAQANQAIAEDFLPARRSFLFDTQAASNGGPIPAAAGAAQLSLAVGAWSGGSDDWLTLTNNGSEAIDLSGWRVDGGGWLKFAPGTVLPAGSTVYLSPATSAFRSRAASPTGGEGLWVLGGLQFVSAAIPFTLYDASGSVVP